MKKKALSAILAGFMLFCLTACGTSFGANDNPPMQIAAVSDRVL